MAAEEASSSGGGEEGSGSGAGGWTREQEKAFENALATVEEEEGEAMWDQIADAVEGKTPEEVRRHYELLVEDVDGIEAGRVPLLVYAGDGEEGGSGGGGGGGGGKKSSGGGGGHGEKGSSKSAEQERRKGIDRKGPDRPSRSSLSCGPAAGRYFCLRQESHSRGLSKWSRRRFVGLGLV